MSVPAHVIVGRVRRAHGIRGELVVESLTDDPESHFAVGATLLSGTITGELSGADDPSPQALTIRRAVPFKGGWILRLDEITSRTAAEPWRNRYLLVPGPALAPPGEGEVYYHDLIDLRVQRPDGVALGRVVELYEVPQGVLLEIETERGTVMVPYHPRMIAHTDVEHGVLVVDPPQGLFEEQQRSSADEASKDDSRSVESNTDEPNTDEPTLDEPRLGGET